MTTLLYFFSPLPHYLPLAYFHLRKPSYEYCEIISATILRSNLRKYIAEITSRKYIAYDMLRRWHHEERNNLTALDALFPHTFRDRRNFRTFANFHTQFSSCLFYSGILIRDGHYQVFLHTSAQFARCFVGKNGRKTLRVNLVKYFTARYIRDK